MDEPQTYWNSWSSRDLNRDVVRGDERPSGLRDAIAEAMQTAWNDFTSDTGCFPDAFELRGRKVYADFTRGNFAQMVANWLEPWLSVVSEGEIEAAARAIHDTQVSSWPPESVGSWDTLLPDYQDFYRKMAEAALAASRGVLLPKETPGSSYSAGSPSMKEHP